MTVYNIACCYSMLGQVRASPPPARPSGLDCSHAAACSQQGQASRCAVADDTPSRRPASASAFSYKPLPVRSRPFSPVPRPPPRLMRACAAWTRLSTWALRTMARCVEGGNCWGACGRPVLAALCAVCIWLLALQHLAGLREIPELLTCPVHIHTHAHTWHLHTLPPPRCAPTRTWRACATAPASRRWLTSTMSLSSTGTRSSQPLASSASSSRSEGVSRPQRGTNTQCEAAAPGAAC